MQTIWVVAYQTCVHIYLHNILILIMRFICINNEQKINKHYYYYSIEQKNLNQLKCINDI